LPLIASGGSWPLIPGEAAARRNLSPRLVDELSDSLHLYGPPPKVISIQLGNCATHDVAALLCARFSELDQFQADPDAALLVLP